MIANRDEYRAARRRLLTLYRRAEPTTGGGPDANSGARPAEIAALEQSVREYEGRHHRSCAAAEPADLMSVPNVLVSARLARGMTQKDLGDFLGLHMQQIQAYEASGYNSASIARLTKIASALGVRINVKAKLEGCRIIKALDLGESSSFPLTEMWRRGWLGTQKTNQKVLLEHAADALVEYFSGDASFPSRRRYARTEREPHEPALLAWERKVLQLASERFAGASFDRDQADAHWRRELMRLSGLHGGMSRVRSHLRTINLDLIVLAGLPGMQIDGATLRTPDGRVIVALTLRESGEDSFWPTLARAISHAVLHVRPSKWDTIFHARGAPLLADFEEEADVLTREILLPSALWNTCKARVHPTVPQIEDDARRLCVAPCILAERLKFELGDDQLPALRFEGRDVRRALKKM